MTARAARASRWQTAKRCSAARSTASGPRGDPLAVEFRPVSSLAMHVDRHFAGSEDFAPKIYRDTRLATGPLASYPIAQHDPLRLEAVGRLGRAAGGVAHLPAIDPAPVVAGCCGGSRAAHL